MNGKLAIAEVGGGMSGGLWGVTLAPGKRGPSAFGGRHERDLDADLDAVAAWGADAVLTLVEADELAFLGIAGIGAGVRARFMEWHHLPVRDGCVPDARAEDRWPGLARDLRALVARGGRVLVHCRGGLGRAGMAVARLLVEGGAGPGEAIAAVRSARGPSAVENAGQEAWVAAGLHVPHPAPSRDAPACRDRAIGAMVGLAVGDAVGTTLEFEPRPRRARLSDMVGGGPFGLRPGQWTDDTAMALALADSLDWDPGLDPADLMARFAAWRERGDYSCTGTCFDVGLTVSAAIGRFRAGGDPIAGSDDPRTAGNGAIMRLAPVAIRHWRDRAELARVADLQGRVTHGAEESRRCVAALALILADAVEGRALGEIVSGRDARSAGHVPGARRASVRGSGYVVDSLRAALWAVASTTDFRSAVLAAANLGEDADTTAAVAGQVAGATYGLAGIPAEWLARLAWRDRIEEAADRLWRASILDRAGGSGQSAVLPSQ